MLVGGKFWPVPRVGHAVLEFRGRAKDFPPQGFSLKQIAQRVVGLLSLQALCIRDRIIRIERVDFIDDGGSSAW
jgi:hypothetical protein